MQPTSVTSKGQITIPKQIRQQLGIRKGSKLEASIVGNHIELYISNTPSDITSTGFAMLKSKRTAVPTDFDPASLLNNDRA
jgi:AbrB family looped-hinge helix DNA binding protein